MSKCANTSHGFTETRWWPTVFMWATMLVVCAAAPPNEPAGQPLTKEIERLAPLAEKFDWEAESPRLERYMENMWRRQGWTGESDRYAFEVARDIIAIPPWYPMKRISALTDRIEKRYELSEPDALRFESALTREVVTVLSRHADAVVQPVQEWLETRINGRPFTSEQIARWAKGAEPLLEELTESANRLQGELKPLVKPSKRSVFERDLEAFQRRSKVVGAMHTRWVQGKWTPTDWGMEDDPIQIGGAVEAERSKLRDGRHRQDAASDAPPRISKALPHEPSTWFVYVRKFEARYELDAGQVSATESILAELVVRAQSYAESHADTLVAIPDSQRPTHPNFEPIRAVFQELRDRLEPIPSSSQRQRRPG